MLFIKTVFLVCAGWAIWTLIRKFTRRSPLDNIPGPAPQSLVFGDLARFFGRHGWSFHRELWNKYGAVVRVNAFFGSPLLYVHDPKALHHVIVKDQYIYEESPIFINFNRLVFGDGILASLGERHRQQRKILNPVFHTNHMRYMEPTFYRITHKLRNAITNEVKGGRRELDILNWMTRTALELVGQGGLGHSFDSLDEDRLNPFAEDLKSLIPTFAPLFVIVRFLPLASRIGTPAFRRRVLELVPWKRIHHAIHIADSMEITSKSILAQKKALLAKGDAALEHEVGEGKDIISVLLRANMQASSEDKMSDEELIGHMSSLIFAAMETTSGALAHILQMLAEHQSVQDKLREELIAARADREQIEYDELMSLPYLEAVCRETLRLHSPATNMTRTTTKDVVMPLHYPIRGNDGTMINEIPIPKGTGIVIGILASNVNTDIWGPDAHEWRPERFLEPLPESVAEAHVPGIYSNLMTFLGGGRACIGFKFSQLEMKVVLSVLIENFRFTPSDKDVYWNWGGVQYPTIGKESSDTKMPMKVELIR